MLARRKAVCARKGLDGAPWRHGVVLMLYRLLYKPVPCNKTKPLRLQSPRRFDHVVLSAPSFCLSLKLLLDRSLLSKQKGSSESCQWYIDRRGSRRPMQISDDEQIAAIQDIPQYINY